MDLSSFDLQDSFDYALETPAGDKLDVVFTIAGPTHPTRDAYAKRMSRRQLREFNRRGKAQLPDDPDEIEQDQADYACAVTLGWRNLSVDGQELAFSAENARRLFGDRRFAWVRSAVLTAAADAANFTPRSSGN